MSISVATPPGAEPVVWVDMKVHMRVSSNTEQTLGEALITSARAYIENWTSRTLITTVYDYTLDSRPSSIELPRAGVQSITSVTITDEDGSDIIVTASNYRLDTTGEIDKVVLKSDGEWGETVEPFTHMTVRFVAGYGDAASSIPAPIIAATKILVAHWFENRELIVVGTNTTPEIEMTVTALLEPYKVWRTM
ncbi:hypothetical protein LCGC14_2067800 [marine sediment metagenome]|uniref:Phage gp6-like head-tail connector protein n=1 Tax=marine sediment metagenome TaxID=412755 RepID=A0A0F9HGB1_9ZZZZ